MTPLLLPVLASKNTPSWPRYSDAPRIGYVDAAEAFERSWPSDAHFAAYSVASVEHRLSLDAIGRLRHGWPMVLMVADVDGPGHKREPAWWAGELLKLEALAAAHPGGFFYATRGGYRLVYRLASPFVIWTVDDKEAWRERYRRELLYLARRFAIVGDPACSDITRLFRLPCVIREAGAPAEDHPTMGDPYALGFWSHEPSDDERDHDVSTARLLASKEPKAWGPVLRALAPERGGQEGQEPAPELRPEDQDEERVFKRAAAYLANMSPSIEGAGGDAALWDAALAMVRGFSLGASTATAMLLRDFNPRCQPSWDRRTVERKCREAAARSTKPWGYLRDAEGGEKGLRFKPSERRQQRHPRRQDDHEGAPMPEHEHDQEQPTEEPPPFLPLATPRDLPAFPLAALPPLVADFVGQIADALECPPDLPACLALGALGAVCMKRYAANPRDDWHEPLNLYLAIALEPGESKSPVFSRVFGPLYALQKKLGVDWKKECELIEERNKDKDKGEPREEKPPRPRLFVDDATPEKIGMIMAEQGECITLASDEGTAFAHMCGLYSKNQQPNAGLYLKAHDGALPFPIDRVGRESIILDSPLMTVALAVQPTVIRELAKRPDLRGRGLWGRFAYAFPASRVGTRTHEGPPMDPMVRDEWRGLLWRLSTLPLPKDPGVLRFSPEAHQRFHQAEQEIERALGPGAALSSVRDWAGKLRGFIARLAGLLHVANEQAPGYSRISLATIENALEIARYFTAHALYTFNIEMTLDPVEQAARQAWEVIQRKGLDRITPAELGRWVRSLRKTTDATGALDALCRQGCLELDPKHRGKGRVYLPRGSQTGGDEKQTKADEKQTKNDTLNTNKTQDNSEQVTQNDTDTQPTDKPEDSSGQGSDPVVFGDLSVLDQKPASTRDPSCRVADVFAGDLPVEVPPVRELGEALGPSAAGPPSPEEPANEVSTTPPPVSGVSVSGEVFGTDVLL